MSHSHFLEGENENIYIPVTLSLESKETDVNITPSEGFLILKKGTQIPENDMLNVSTNFYFKNRTEFSSTSPSKISATEEIRPSSVITTDDEPEATNDFKLNFKKIVYIPAYFSLAVKGPDDFRYEREDALSGFLKINPYRLTSKSVNFKELATLTTLALQYNTFYQVGENILEGMQIVSQDAWYKKSSGYFLLKAEIDGANVLSRDAKSETSKKYFSLKQNTIIAENDIIDFTVCTYNQKPGLPTTLPKTIRNWQRHNSIKLRLFDQTRQLTQTTADKNMMPKLGRDNTS